MEATLLSSPRFHPKLSGPNTQANSLPLFRPKPTFVSLQPTNPNQLCQKNSASLTTRVSAKFSDNFRNEYADNVVLVGPQEGEDVVEVDESEAKVVGVMFRNRYLDLVRIGSVVNNAAEAFFKSEIRRRLCVTAALIVISRVGYFVPLPGFDRRLIPQDYLSFVSGSVDELGDFSGELKMSLFQLGISPQIIASIIMQVLTYVVPSLAKLRK